MSFDFLDAKDESVSNYELKKLDSPQSNIGHKNLKELKPIHLEAVIMHLDGVKNIDIADALDLTSVSISTILHDPLVVAILDAAKEENRERIGMLMGKSIDVIDEAMNRHNTIDDRLKGASLYLKEASKHGDSGGKTAEDVVQKIMNLQINGDINITKG